MQEWASSQELLGSYLASLQSKTPDGKCKGHVLTSFYKDIEIDTNEMLKREVVKAELVLDARFRDTWSLLD